MARNPNFLPEDDVDSAGSSVGEDGLEEAPMSKPKGNFPRANMHGTEHYDETMPHHESTPYSHGGGGLSSYGTEHPQHRSRLGERMNDVGAEAADNAPARFARHPGSEGLGEVPQDISMRGGRMRDERADRQGDEQGHIEHGVGESYEKGGYEHARFARQPGGDGLGEVPQHHAMRGGRMADDRAEAHGDEMGHIEHGIGEGRMKERHGGKAVSQAGGRGRRR